MSDKKMFQSELVKNMKAELGGEYQQKELDYILEAMKAVMRKTIRNGRGVDLKHFGSIIPYNNKARICTNPQTKVKFHKDACVTVKFRSTVRLKEFVNS